MKSLCAIIIVGCAAILSATAQAAENAEATQSSGRSIDEIVVTATYRETSLMDTPQAISAVDAYAIEQLGATDLQDLFRYIPGLNVSSMGTGEDRIVVRGISSQTGTYSFSVNTAMVAVYIDDTPVTSAQGPARQLGGSLFDIERVEVLKGPQGTLFGEGSQGGTIRYLYNQPDTERVDYKVKAGYVFQDESDDTGYRLDVMGNMPLSDSLALRLSVFNESTAGWIDNTSVSPVERDTNSTDSNGGRLAAKWMPTDRLSVLGSFVYVDTETEGTTLAQRPYEENFNGHLPGLSPYSKDEVSVYSLRFDYEFDWGTFTSVSSYFDREADSVTEIPAVFTGIFDGFVGLLINLGSLGAGGPILIPCNPGTQDMFLSNPAVCPYGDLNSLTSSVITSVAKTERYAQEFRIVSNGSGPWLWTAGLFYKNSEDGIASTQPFGLAPDREYLRPIWNPIFIEEPSNAHTDTFEEIAGFGEVTYAPNEKWEFTVGARVSNMQQEFEFTTTDTNDTPFSPKVTVAWRPG